jgi:integrase
MKIKIAAILYTSNQLSNGEHPIVLRISQAKVRKYVFLGISCPKDLWDSKKNLPTRKHPQHELFQKIIHQTIHTYHTKLLELELVSQNKLVTPADLIQALQDDARKEETSKIFPFFDQTINKLLQLGKVGTALVYKDTKRSLKLFTPYADLLFTDINPTFLHNYEVYLRTLGLAETSMSVYFRTLRALFNKAIQEKLINLNHYPFKEFSVTKFNTATKKRAITKEEIKKIENLELDPTSSLAETRRIFMASYYFQGINFKDLSELQWRDIIENRIFYTRAKTGKMIHFKLLSPAQAIIEHYRPLTGNHPENYIFPILNRLQHVTALQIAHRVAKVRKKVNSEMREIARLAQIDANPTTYVARHTYATVLKKSDVSIAKISQALGHSSELVTQTYLKEFEDEEMDRANECLL